jgi:hypothetical protein
MVQQSLLVARCLSGGLGRLIPGGSPVAQQRTYREVIMLESQEEQEERRRVALQDADLRRQQQQRGSTFHQHAQAQADELSQGRFAAIGTPTVTGATPIPKYPAAGAHQSDPVGIEPPLGIDINAMPESSMATTRPTEETCAPVGAAAAAERLPPGSAQSDDAGASFS